MIYVKLCMFVDINYKELKSSLQARTYFLQIETAFD